jgi:hypothetical protein
MNVRKLWRRAANTLLYAAEGVFLLAHGWRPSWTDDGRQLRWYPPDDYGGRVHDRDHGHAVNSQKYFSRNPIHAEVRSRLAVPR